MLAHELFDALLEGFDRGPHLRTNFVVLFAADFLVPHHAHCEVISEAFGAYDFRYGTGGPAIVLEQFFQAVLCLGITHGIRGCFEGLREYMWDPIFVAVDGCSAISSGFVRPGLRARYSNQGQGEKDSG